MVTLDGFFVRRMNLLELLYRWSIPNQNTGWYCFIAQVDATFSKVGCYSSTAVMSWSQQEGDKKKITLSVEIFCLKTVQNDIFTQVRESPINSGYSSRMRPEIFHTCRPLARWEALRERIFIPLQFLDGHCASLPQHFQKHSVSYCFPIAINQNS